VGSAGFGAPGATTLALALAAEAAGPAGGTGGGLVVEADADGGVLVARYGLAAHPAAPSLDTLVAALASGAGPAGPGGHVQRLPGGLAVVPCGVTAEAAAGAVGHLPGRLDALRERTPGRLVLLDVGRVRPTGPSWELAGGCDGLVLVLPASLEGLMGGLNRLPTLAGHVRRVVLAVRGDGPYRMGQIRDLAAARGGWAVPVLAVPDDARGAARLAEAGPRTGRRPRSALGRAAARLLEAFAALGAGDPAAGAGASGAGAGAAGAGRVGPAIPPAGPPPAAVGPGRGWTG
jgi:hypothetical protein